MNQMLKVKNRFRTALGRAQSGQGSVELVISGVMFVIMFAAIASLSLFLFLSHTFTMAADVGVREAATNTDLGSATNYSRGVSTVKSRVVNFVNGSSGVRITDADVTVTGPVGAAGDRQITVNLAHEFQNPIPVLTAISTMFGGNYGADKYTLQSSATMRYEE